MFSPATPISRRAFLASATAGLAAACWGCSASFNTAASRSATQGSTFAFDTYCTFAVYGDSTVLSLLSQECARLDKLLNLYDSTSDIARINAAQGARVEVDPTTAAVIAQALPFCEAAAGAFDITIGAVSTLWDFDAGTRPSDTELTDALTHVDWTGVDVDQSTSTVRLRDPQAKLDLGGIAKGFAADRLVTLLHEHKNVDAAMISLGGNIMLYGTKPDHTPWRVGIRDPHDPSGSTVVRTVSPTGGMSLVTSGLYERTFTLDGVTYWHILNPKTGLPVQTDVLGVTVACTSSTTADALSTTLFVDGSTKGCATADAHPDCGALFVLANNQCVASSRWNQLAPQA